ncbi:MAG TPA: hypothetical protein VKT99_09290 [Xanthobacteraceae bacterium]|jgi:hypothetical protein|nr:hypothetical protein [Xanthobacteraceae bacterium]
MFNPLNRAQRYRELAEGCRHLAALGLSAETRDHFLQMAEHYATLADAEEAGSASTAPT